MKDSCEISENSLIMDTGIEPTRHRFPFCVVWTPIPLLTYLFPFIGHMGIGTSKGIIVDFAGPYHVSEDSMAFGWPTKYWQLDYAKAKGGVQGWDSAIAEGAEVYRGRMHNLCWDNCYSHVALTLKLMNYDNTSHWNMIKIGFLMTIYGKYISFRHFVQTWGPFTIIISVILLIYFLT
ncbi:transmembrane protein 222 [Leptopilina heterotoma]|uniref:transmembrane protein 222 n=1 Tax=Leptopilina heterotoma TaxID=63436 RepID=UPI001CA874DA|nr:transmembrane protein 222 [Leptopilina heterotoma]